MNETTRSFLGTTIPSIAEVVTITFSWYDYVIFAAMLTVSALIGIYFGCFGTKQSTASEYLMGGNKMHVFPIAMSLVASHISGITLLGVPADVYKYGAGYWWCVVSFLFVGIISIFVYLPVLFEAKITSVYEYLGRRFDEKTQMFSSFLFALSQILFLPLVVYIPALALSAATGINIHLITPVVCGVCIFYTTIGGLKAVVWTDTLQFTVTLGSVTAVLILGIKSTGGFGEIWNKAIEGHRLDILNFEPDPTMRDNFWAVAVGFGVLWVAFTNTNQGCVQKLLSVATLRDAKLVVIYFMLGLALVKTASVITGLIIYAKYADCDPFSTNQIKKNDQLLPYYVLDVAGKIPGLSGLFISGVFSAGLSTLSAHLNCLSGTLYEDFIGKWLPKTITEQSKSNILKLIVVICGVVCTVLIFIFERLGGIIPLAISFAGITGGPLLGMFTLGVLVRRANCKGAFYGGVIGTILIILLALPGQYLKSMGVIHYPQQPVSTEGCNFTVIPESYYNQTKILTPDDPEGPLIIFKISFYYNALIGCFFTVISGLIISFSTKKDDKPIDENLLSPIIQRASDDSQLKDVIEYNTVEKALHIVVNNSDKEHEAQL